MGESLEARVARVESRLDGLEEWQDGVSGQLQVASAELGDLNSRFIRLREDTMLYMYAEFKSIRNHFKIPEPDGVKKIIESERRKKARREGK